MELQAWFYALEHVRDVVYGMDIDRVQIVTDSLYTFNNQRMAVYLAKKWMEDKRR